MDFITKVLRSEIITYGCHGYSQMFIYGLLASGRFGDILTVVGVICGFCTLMCNNLKHDTFCMCISSFTLFLIGLTSIDVLSIRALGAAQLSGGFYVKDSKYTSITATIGVLCIFSPTLTLMTCICAIHVFQVYEFGMNSHSLWKGVSCATQPQMEEESDNEETHRNPIDPENEDTSEHSDQDNAECELAPPEDKNTCESIESVICDTCVPEALLISSTSRKLRNLRT